MASSGSRMLAAKMDSDPGGGNDSATVITQQGVLIKKMLIVLYVQYSTGTCTVCVPELTFMLGAVLVQRFRQYTSLL